MSLRIYRDPVHNIIPLRDDSDEGRLMIRLIDTPEFQRLRLEKHQRCVKAAAGIDIGSAYRYTSMA